MMGKLSSLEQVKEAGRQAGSLQLAQPLFSHLFCSCMSGGRRVTLLRLKTRSSLPDTRPNLLRFRSLQIRRLTSFYAV